MSTLWRFPAEVAEIVGDEPQIATDLLAAFLEDCRTLIGKLRSGVGTQQIATVHSAAHALKGASAQMGADELTAMSRRLEHEENWEQISLILEQLAAHYRLLSAAIQAYQTQLNTAEGDR